MYELLIAYSIFLIIIAYKVILPYYTLSSRVATKAKL